MQPLYSLLLLLLLLPPSLLLPPCILLPLSVIYSVPLRYFFTLRLALCSTWVTTGGSQHCQGWPLVSRGLTLRGVEPEACIAADCRGLSAPLRISLEGPIVSLAKPCAFTTSRASAYRLYEPLQLCFTTT